MGTITRGLANNVTTAGRIAASGISNSSVTSVTSFAGITGASGSFTRLSTTTVSSATASVTLTGMDSTYKLYMIDYAGVAPVSDSVHLQCKWSSDNLNADFVPSPSVTASVVASIPLVLLSILNNDLYVLDIVLFANVIQSPYVPS